MDDDPENFELPPDIKRMVMELGQAKRSELSRSNISLTSLAREPVVKANPMGSNWTESEDYALFVGSKQKPIDWVSIASGLKNRTPEQCRLRWNHLTAPLQIKVFNSTPSLLPSEQPQLQPEPPFQPQIAHPMLTIDDLLQGMDVEIPFQHKANEISQQPQYKPIQENDSGEAFLKELFNEGPMGSLPQLTSNPINTNYFTPNVDSAINFNAVNQLQNEPIFSPLNFPTPVATTAPHLPPEFLTPSNLKREPNAPKFLSEKVFRKRTELCPEPHASNKEPISAKEKILEIANLLKLNPQLIPVIEKLSDLVAQLPKGASTDQILSDVEFPGSLRGGRPDSLQNTPDLFTRSRLGGKRHLPTNSRAPNLKSGRTDHGADNLLYQFATEDLPDELEGDHDFINNDYDPEIDNEAPVVTNRELKELFEDSESSTNEESEKKKFRIKTEEHQTEPPLFSTEVLSRIRSQQQQNLQLVLQAYAIECRFRGAESEKALYWKSQAFTKLSIKKLSDFGRACTSTSLEDPTFDPEDTRSFISFFTVPGADYMDAMLEAFTNPPEAIGCASGAPTKSKTPVMSMKKRDWAVYFPEKDFIAPNSPKNVVDKARCISVLIDEIFQPIFLKRLKPFFATIKKRDRPIFTPAEDNLFTIGLYKFGDDWASIRSHLLPPRSSRQLENRFNNLKSRRAQYTPIQQYYLRQIKPLTLKEEELLTQGVRYYGRKFRVISQRMIPNRPSFVLKKAWREMELRKIALNRPVFLDSYH